MSMNCKIAMDLAELYKADLVSPETAAAIRAHLKTCPDCRKYYREYDLIGGKEHAAALGFDEDLSGTENRMYLNLSKRLAHRRILQIVGTSAAIGAGTIMLAVGILLMTKPNKKL